MGARFDRCVASGGKVRTRTHPGGKYQRICTLGGKTYLGRIKRKKSDKSK